MRAEQVHLARDGWVPLPGLLTASALDALRDAAADLTGPVRDACAAIPLVREVAQDPRVRGAAGAALGGDPFLVRATWFDKAPGANWPVAWHQDKTIPVAERAEVEGFGPWSVKDGRPHVEAPLAVLERMVAVRILVDDCDAACGPLRVVPGTHRAKHSRADIDAAVARGPVVDCVGAAGDALLMRPLLVHGSRRAAPGRRRRVLHIEYATGSLAPPLRWRL
jgi:hypothetical protein